MEEQYHDYDDALYKCFEKESLRTGKKVSEQIKREQDDSLDILVFPAYHKSERSNIQLCAANRTDNLQGAQLGLVNVAGNGQGLQLGVANGAVDEFYGLEIGVINVGAEYGTYLQIGGITARPGDGPLYKRISPIIGFRNKRKPKE